MWLLDANMDVHLTRALAEFGIVSETAADRGWKALSNGQLVAAAVAGGFDCLLTRDRLLGESASYALRLHSTFAVILINLPQQTVAGIPPALPEGLGLLPDRAQARMPD
jgi:hypothetical protein